MYSCAVSSQKPAEHKQRRCYKQAKKQDTWKETIHTLTPKPPLPGPRIPPPKPLVQHKAHHTSVLPHQLLGVLAIPSQLAGDARELVEAVGGDVRAHFGPCQALEVGVEGAQVGALFGVREGVGQIGWTGGGVVGGGQVGVPP